MSITYTHEEVVDRLRNAAEFLANYKTFTQEDWEELKPRIAASLEQGRVGHIGWYAWYEYEDLRKTYNYEGTEIQVMVRFHNEFPEYKSLPDVKRTLYVHGQDLQGIPYHNLFSWDWDS
jgi:hypothetical protein